MPLYKRYLCIGTWALCIVLVGAFLRDKGAKCDIFDLYAIVIAERFRFYSFGDTMLII